MERDPHYARIGLFVILAFMAAVSFFFIISKWDYQDRNNIFAIYFDGDVTGLRVNEEVLYQGISVGKIKRISIPSKSINKVMVLVNIKKPSLIRTDTIATIEAQGLTGLTFVQLRGGSQDSPLVTVQPGHKYPIIASRQSNISSVVSEMPKILMRVDKIIESLTTLVTPEAMADLKGTFANMHKITSQLAEAPKGIQATVAEIHGMAQSLNRASLDFAKVLEENSAYLADFHREGLPQITQTARKANNLMDSLDQMTQSLNASPLGFLKKSQSPGYQLEGSTFK